MGWRPRSGRAGPRGTTKGGPAFGSASEGRRQFVRVGAKNQPHAYLDGVYGVDDGVFRDTRQGSREHVSAPAWSASENDGRQLAVYNNWCASPNLEAANLHRETRSAGRSFIAHPGFDHFLGLSTAHVVPPSRSPIRALDSIPQPSSPILHPGRAGRFQPNRYPDLVPAIPPPTTTSNPSTQPQNPHSPEPS
jgi:hypothetical protein